MNGLLNAEEQFDIGDKVICLTPEVFKWTKDKIGIIVEVMDFPLRKGVLFGEGGPVHSWPEGSLALYLAPPPIDVEIQAAVFKWKEFFDVVGKK